MNQRFIVTASHARVRGSPRQNGYLICSLRAGTSLPAYKVPGARFSGSPDWARVTLESGVIGYIRGGAGRWEWR